MRFFTDILTKFGYFCLILGEEICDISDLVWLSSEDQKLFVQPCCYEADYKPGFGPKRVKLRDATAREDHLAICANAKDKRLDLDWCKNNFARRTYRCPVESCLKLFFSRGKCNNHRISAHNHKIVTKDGDEVKLEKVECQKRGCKKLFANKNSMMKHFRLKHGKTN